MAITNGYATVEDLRSDLGITDGSDADDDARIEQAVESASRLIDRWCSQRFWEDPSDTTRYFTPHSHSRLRLSQASAPHDIEATTLTSVTSVAVDTSGDGTFNQTWTEGTHFFLSPRGAAESDRPYTTLERLAGGYTFHMGLPDSVKIVGTFGWPSVPDDVAEACRIQAQVLFKRATEGAASIVTMDGLTLSGGSKYLDREAQLLLRPFRPIVGV